MVVILTAEVASLRCVLGSTWTGPELHRMAMGIRGGHGPLDAVRRPRQPVSPHARRDPRLCRAYRAVAVLHADAGDARIARGGRSGDGAARASCPSRSGCCWRCPTVMPSPMFESDMTDPSLPRHFLFLQGPHGSFFPRLAAVLVADGHHVHRINLNGGDRATWPDGDSFRGLERHWDAYLVRYLAQRTGSPISSCSATAARCTRPRSRRRGRRWDPGACVRGGVYPPRLDHAGARRR